MATCVSGGQQGPLAELLGDAEQPSAEVGGGRGVLGEEGGQAQQAGRLAQALEVLGVLGQPRAEHGAHGPAEIGAENIYITCTPFCTPSCPPPPAPPLIQPRRQNAYRGVDTSRRFSAH